MRVLLINTNSIMPEIIDTPGGLAEWYKLINCDLIDITTRNIGGRSYDIIMDDEALLKAGGKITALDSNGEPQLVGNLIICNYNDAAGTEESLTDEDIRHIINNLVVLTEKTDRPNPQQWTAIINVDAD